MQFSFQEKNSYTLTVWGLLDKGSVRPSAVASDMGREGVSVAAAVAFANSSAALLPGTTQISTLTCA